MKTIRVLQFVIACIYTTFIIFLFSSPLLPGVEAVTTRQERLRIANEMIARHPDLPPCDQACQDNWVAGNPWLVSLSTRLELPLDVIIRAHQSETFEWGVQFERLYRRPPTMHDWISSYADRAEAFRSAFDVAPPLFAVNRWAEQRYYRLKWEYGGPY